MESIGEFLKGLRMSKKMSLREASEKSGLSHSYIRYLENGKRPGSNTPINPTPDTLKSLAEAYNYSYEDLMHRAGYLRGESNDKMLDREELFVNDLSNLELTTEEIVEKFNLTVDGVSLTPTQLKRFVNWIRAERME